MVIFSLDYSIKLMHYKKFLNLICFIFLNFSLFALSKVVFLCIERDGVSFKIKIIDENQKTLNETQVVENNNIPKQSSNNLGLGAYFSNEFLVLSFLDSNKIIKYHHNHRFLPAIEMNLIGMRMLISSNDEICFYYDKRNVIRVRSHFNYFF